MRWLAILWLAAAVHPAFGTLASLELHVVDTENRPLDGIAVSLSGTETEVRTVDGGVQLPLPRTAVSGTRVRLEVHERDWALISPWDGELQVPLPNQPAVKIVLGKRGDRETLASGTAMTAIAQRVAHDVAKAMRDQGVVTDDARRRILEKRSAEIGFTAKQVDAALRAVRDATPNGNDRRAIEQYLAQFPVYVAGDLNLTVQQARPRFSLDGELDHLGLAGKVVLSVQAMPSTALDGARCIWSFDPPNLLQPSANGSCRAEVIMPSKPFANRGSSVPAHASVRIEKNGELLDELSARGSLHNGMKIEVIASKPGIAPSAPVTGKVVRQGTTDPIPTGFRCVWNVVAAWLMTFQPSTPNECEGILAYKPEKQWAQMEGITYAALLRAKSDLSVPVRLQSETGTIYESDTAIHLAMDDARDPLAVQRSFESQSEGHAVAESPGIYSESARSGLPPLKDFGEKTLTLELSHHRQSWEIVTRYTAKEPADLKGPLDQYGGLLKMSYSRDGEHFERAHFDQHIESLAEIAATKELWVKFEAASRTAGPFRLPFDFDSAARAAVWREWKGMPTEDQRQAACSGLLMGGESAYVPGEHHLLLSVIDEISVGRDETALWRNKRYDSKIGYLFNDNFEKLRPPIGPSDYLARVRFRGGALETYHCRGQRSVVSLPAGGRYCQLARTTKTAGGWPSEIEIYLYGGWTVAYYVDVTPAAVRFSTDGKAFRTVSTEGTVAFDHADGNRLVLRFVLDDGSEVEYAGAVDYGAYAVAASRAALFERGKFTCHHDKSGAVACVFRRLDKHSIGAYYTVDEALGILRSVDYGCSRDSLDHRDNLETLRETKRSTYEAFRLQVKASCDSVFARFALSDGSQSPLLVAPVSSEER
jgi:hypothetical protein